MNIPSHTKKIKGRGSAENPANRFKPLYIERQDEFNDPEAVHPDTQFLKDNARQIIVKNDSPDVGFDAGINPYRGCEHGCVYCYARPGHEYLELSAGLDFETKILVKENAPELLRKELSAKSWTPQVLALSGATDSYQPAEKHLQITRKCLEVLLEFKNPVVIITKSSLVTRDIDLLQELAQSKCAAVYISVTSLDSTLSRTLEPRASLPEKRLETIGKLRQAGIPVGVLVAPVIPALTDHEIPAIVSAASEAGAGFAGKIVLRLPHGVADLFQAWLERHVPNKKEKVLNRIREIRGGKLNDSRFATRMQGEGVFAQQIQSMFSLACRKAGLAGKGPELSTEFFQPPAGRQLNLF